MLLFQMSIPNTEKMTKSRVVALLWGYEKKTIVREEYIL